MRSIKNYQLLFWLNIKFLEDLELNLNVLDWNRKNNVYFEIWNERVNGKSCFLRLILWIVKPFRKTKVKNAVYKLCDVKDKTAVDYSWNHYDNKIQYNKIIFLKNGSDIYDVDVITFSVNVIGLSTKSIVHIILLQSLLILHPSARDASAHDPSIVTECWSSPPKKKRQHLIGRKEEASRLEYNE